MASKEKSTRFHPYDTTKKPKIHRSTDNTTPKRRHNNTTTQKQPTNKNSTGDKSLSINDLKRRIRDVKRLLTRAENLSPEARIVQERALKGYERDLEQEQARRRRSEMIRKYHFVRFLDRKTATKQLRTAQRQYEKAKQQDGQDENKLAALKKRIDMAQIDVNYTIYYPLTEKYLSLYPQEKKREVVNGHNQNVDKSDGDDKEEESDDEEMQTSEDENTRNKAEGKKPPMWEIIKKCMADKTLDRLRDGKLNIGFDGKPLQNLDSTAMDKVVKSTTRKEKAETTKNKEKGEKKRKRKEVEADQSKEEEEEDSDGGFFEE